ncbi:MAG TPA: acetylglutamate kinase [Gemmatimonadales bacterium]|nr:acetylglutamate kinase [Gemmatimonadales bacterium]
MKLGGRALEAPGALSECAAALRDTGEAGRSARAHAHPSPGRPTLVVHGGGAEVTAWCARAGIAARFADGLRVTDPATLEIAAAVLAGLANKRLVAALRAQGVDAVGLAALDGGIAQVRRHANSATLGEVGEIESVDASLLEDLLAAGRTPVLASLGADGAGALLNLNADDVAAAIAAALPAGDLLLLSDTPGLKLGGEVVRTLDPAALDGALEHPDVSGGMRPKLRAARMALAAGVRLVHIAAWHGTDTIASVLAGRGVATTCHAGAPAPTEEESHA